ncbi:MAG: hypothetical protein A2029_05775 [Chloroflexi bacterium RBG_19FT_COMBO_47_9]|nr:MAG: hypothetical protein A2Y53_06170 [Chloroflexi bacterium RBG_16_47_49]OGO59994.1 MAG: hypothetical protein A2029_05775 [Chloroflexi bacterium RBG_19FT_COMBO_47_9]
MDTILTKGSIWRTLLNFTIPYLLACVLQTMDGTIDLIIVGQFSPLVSDLSAVSNGSHIIHVITNVISGFTMGSTVLIGQYVGAGRHESVSRAIGTTLTLFFCIGTISSIVIIASSSLIIRTMNIPTEAMAATSDYIIICGCGLVFFTAYNTFSAILRGLGDSKSPLVFIAIGCAIHIAGDILLIGVFGLGVRGAAYTTVSAQGLSVLFAFYRLKYRHNAFDFKLRSFRPNRSDARKITRVGMPIATEYALVNASFVFISAMINSFGVVASAAIGVCEKIGALARVPASAFSASVAAMVAQNMGAGLLVRSRRTLWTSIGMSLALSFVFFAVVHFIPIPILRIYTDNGDVIAAAVEYMRSFNFDTLLVCGTFCMAGFFAGCNKSLFTLIRNMASTFLVRVPLAYIFCHASEINLFKIGLAAPIASAASIIICLLYYKFGRWSEQTLV